MTQKIKFESQALKANLASTSPGKLKLTREDAWFLNLSKNHYGIHRGAREYLAEVYHPYPHFGLLVEQLRKITIKDIWFYQTHDQAQRAFLVMAGFFEREFAFPLRDTEKVRLVQSLIDFIVSLLKLIQKNPAEFTAVLKRCVFILDKELRKDRFIRVRASSLIKQLPAAAVEDQKIQKKIAALLKHALQDNLVFWKQEISDESRLSGFQGDREIFSTIILPRLKKELENHLITAAGSRLDRLSQWQDLVEVVDFSYFRDLLRRMIDSFSKPIDKVYYISFLFDLKGMSDFKDHLLWDMNRVLRALDFKGDSRKLHIFLDQIFAFWNGLDKRYKSMVLDCILTLGRCIYSSGDNADIDYFLDKVVRTGFEGPDIRGINQDWQTCYNKNHVHNIRIWLKLIEMNPEQSRKLLSALIINLRIGGVFLADTDLFQQDITRLLNADISSSYKLVKQLAAVFPVYFNEIGAEGELRRITTSIDELTQRQDRLIHFLRKQVHSESNNTHIALVKSIYFYWNTGDVSVLPQNLPEDIQAWVRGEGEDFRKRAKAALSILELKSKLKAHVILDTDSRKLRVHIREFSDQTRIDARRILLLLDMLRLLREKYSLDSENIIAQLQKLSKQIPVDEIELLDKLLIREGREHEAVRCCFRLLAELKKIILDPRESRGWEDIYRKRHIAAGIPSMYGQYREPKFEALGLTFRLEKVVTRLLDRIIDRLNLSYMTAENLKEATVILDLFKTGFELSGVSSEGFSSNLEMLKYSLTTSSFTVSQFVNIFQFMSRNWNEVIRKYFILPHEENLGIILEEFSSGNGDPGGKKMSLPAVQKKAESFFRSIIATSFLVQNLDVFIGRMLNTLNTMSENLEPEVLQLIMSYSPDLLFSPVDELTAKLDNQVFLGAKGYFLKKLKGFGFPVPEGFILTTETFRRRKVIYAHPEVKKEFDQKLKNQLVRLELKTGRKYGDPENPLLLSVRSGAAISMPGAMHTFLNVGLNDYIVECLSRKPNMDWTAWDCYRRFLQNWGMIHGISRDEFDQKIIDFKRQFKVRQKLWFSPEQMKIVALSYKNILKKHKVVFTSDPFEQLILAARAVMDFWETERARVYRSRLKISDDWGTAVIVQKMVLGNLNDRSGSGVVFTRDPGSSAAGIRLYGDFTICSQGEDVVGGLVYPLPVSESQRKQHGSHSGLSLEKDFPQIYRELEKMAVSLISERGFPHQEIEFTFESGRSSDLFVLQTRDFITPAANRIPVFQDKGKKTKLLGTGVGIGGGALNGIVAIAREDLAQCRRDFPGEKVILVRPDTVPDDIDLIFECDGLLTARGGATSHAALTASRLGKTCIVNCQVLKVFEQQNRCVISGAEFRPGDKIAIDGRLGYIYQGHYPVSMENLKDHQGGI